MDDLLLKKFSLVIKEKIGLDFSTNLSSLTIKIGRRSKELSLSLHEYIQYTEKNVSEWDILITFLTINETYFYREEHQLNELVTSTLPDLYQKNPYNDIYIWSAACSTGEEPYTIAMMIAERNQIPLHKIKIIATDIDTNVLALAEKGFYSKHSFCFRKMPKKWFQMYFTETEKGYYIKDEIKKMVTFKPLNLMSSSYLPAYQFDAILCRNVLIYFDLETTLQIIEQFAKKLKNNAYLFLGHSESITGRTDLFDVHHQNRAFYYVKKT
jgi:chemotaxis protein methyltransferase CheR